VLEADITGLAPFTPLLKVQPGFFMFVGERLPEGLHTLYTPKELAIRCTRRADG
jgi:hypothetical protein